MQRTIIACSIAVCFSGGAHAQALQSEWRLSRYFAAVAAENLAPAGTRVVPRLIHDFRVASNLGPTVAVIDTGVNITHVNFAGRLAPGAYEVFGGTSDVADAMGHGTAVASMLSAQTSTAGNVLDFRVLPIRVFNGPTASDQNLSDGLRYSVGRAGIVNLSLSAPGPIAQSAMMESVAAGQLLVVAAGNRAQPNPDWPARFAQADWAGGRIIAVGAVDANNAMASFSNRAGDAKEAFIVALGVGVLGASAFSDTGLVSLSGTSAAAPMVAGAAASIRAHWPYLSAEQIAGILFVSATDLGAPGVDEVFGHGLLNLDQALQPIGTSNLPLASGATAPLASASFSPGAIAGAGLRAASARGELRSVALDKYRRAYEYDLGTGIAAAPRLTANQLFGAADRIAGFSVVQGPTGAKLAFGVDAAREHLARDQLYDYDSRDRVPIALTAFSMLHPFGSRAELASGMAGSAGMYFGVNAFDRHDPSTFHSAALGSPILALIPGHSHLAAGVSTADGIKLKAGLVSSAGANGGREQFAPGGASPSRANVYVLDVSKVGQLGTVGATIQQLRERSAYFNSTGGDAYRISAAPTTTAMTLFTRYDFARDWSFAGQVTVAGTPGFVNTEDSLISRVSTSTSRAFAFSATRTDFLHKSDRLGLTLSQPLRAESGAMTLDLPTAVDAQGEVIRTSRVVPFRPSGRERLAELSYARAVGKASAVGVAAIHRAEPNHDASAADERIVAIRYSAAF